MPKKRKKSKFKKPRAGMRSAFKSGQISPYAAPVYQKGFVYAKLRHTVLAVNQMAEADKRMVQATLKTITDGEKAKTLPDGINGWSCTVLDLRGRAYIVSYRGIEVALFYKRQLTEILLQPGDRFPEGVIQDPIEAWMRLDLLGLSAKKANLVLTTQHHRVEEESRILSSRVVTLQQLNDNLESDNKRLKQQYEEIKKQGTKKKARKK